MVFNHYSKEVRVKVLYWGPHGAGKTTNLKFIANKIGTIKHTFLVDSYGSTIFFDYVEVTETFGGYNICYSLFASPGQSYYQALRKLLIPGTDFVVFIFDSSVDRISDNMASFEELEDLLLKKKIPFVVQANKRDLEKVVSIEEIEKMFPGIPVIDAVAIDGTGVERTFEHVSLYVKSLLK